MPISKYQKDFKSYRLHHQWPPCCLSDDWGHRHHLTGSLQNNNSNTYNSFTRQSIKATKKHRNLVQGTLSRQSIQYCTWCCSSFNILEHQCFLGILLSSQFMDNGSNNNLYCKIHVQWYRYPWRTFCGSTEQQNP